MQSMLDGSDAMLVLAEMRDSGTVACIDGSTSDFVEFISPSVGEIIYNLVMQLEPRSILELGLAYAHSSLYMLQALAHLGQGQLISSDPYQAGDYKGAGIETIRRAGLSDYHTFVEECSEFLLPSLLQQAGGASLDIDMVFIDTNHRFDQTMVEMFYVDKLVGPGAVVFFDDYWCSSVQSACNFVEKNLSYSLHPVHDEYPDVLKDTARILVKDGVDKRKWFHFEPFEIVQKAHNGYSESPFED